MFTLFAGSQIRFVSELVTSDGSFVAHKGTVARIMKVRKDGKAVIRVDGYPTDFAFSIEILQLFSEPIRHD